MGGGGEEKGRGGGVYRRGAPAEPTDRQWDGREKHARGWVRKGVRRMTDW